MYILGYFLLAVARVVDIVLFTYMIIVFGAVVVSWIGADPYNPIVRFLRQATSPVFYYLRRKLPFLTVGMIDFSPFVVILAIIFLQQFLVATLETFARQLLIQ
jgi:YggT family protein